MTYDIIIIVRGESVLKFQQYTCKDEWIEVYGGVAKLVDALVLGACGYNREGSNPFSATRNQTAQNPGIVQTEERLFWEQEAACSNQATRARNRAYILRSVTLEKRAMIMRENS